MLEDYRKVNRFRVPFSDVDMLRHVNNTAYARWAEVLRSEYFIDVLGGDIAGSCGMILAKMEIIYERPMVYRERVAAGCRVSRIGTKSFDFTCEVWSEDRTLRCARIACVMVAMDHDTGTTVEVPASWRERIAAFDAGIAA